MRKAIAVIEVVGGILAFILIAVVLYQNRATSITSANLVSLFIFIGLFGLINIFAGINLWKNKKSGYVTSMITQLLQLFTIQTSSFYMAFYSILGLVVAFSKTGILTTYSLGVSALLTNNPQPVSVTFIGINLVALVMLILLLIAYRRDYQAKI